MIDADKMRRAFSAVSVTMAQQRDYLIRLDQRNGDGDLGISMAEGYHTTPTTVQTVRTSYCEKGLAATINGKKCETPPVPAKVTGDTE